LPYWHVSKRIIYAPDIIFSEEEKAFEVRLPPGSWVEVHSTEWMTAELFLVWFKKLVAFSKASKDFPVLFISDGLSDHTKNLKVINYARDDGILLLCLPTHCSRVYLMCLSKPLSLHYADKFRKWLRCNPGKVLRLFQISMLF